MKLAVWRALCILRPERDRFEHMGEKGASQSRRRKGKRYVKNDPPSEQQSRLLCARPLFHARLLGLEAFCRFEGARELLMGIVELVLHSVLASAGSAVYTFCVTGRRLRAISFPFGHGDVHMYRNAVVKREEQKTCPSTRTGPTTRRTCQDQRRSASHRLAQCPSPLQRQLTATLSDLHSSTDLSLCTWTCRFLACPSLCQVGLSPPPPTPFIKPEVELLF
jgi:hypothetical protein